ncbi:hypothetical protein M413DRAFT_293547 [Hebeloma cylindrosporum]|uniref:Uncharacterized protein n=1 Tax=Hebeloma cylindrosporum TaxID=76867 RepID=A0A0C3CAE2_HEBCY|nr:hypothetical protein M413DRAFT_293547 [Hebeloma cylindrosporum h7]
MTEHMSVTKNLSDSGSGVSWAAGGVEASCWACQSLSRVPNIKDATIISPFMIHSFKSVLNMVEASSLPWATACDKGVSGGVGCTARSAKEGGGVAGTSAAESRLSASGYRQETARSTTPRRTVVQRDTGRGRAASTHDSSSA